MMFLDLHLVLSLWNLCELPENHLNLLFETFQDLILGTFGTYPNHNLSGELSPAGMC